MFRRCSARWAVVLASEASSQRGSAVSTETNDVSAAPSLGSTDKTGPSAESLNAAAASEAPHVLLPYEAPKPFISAKKAKDFVASVAVGAAAVGTVYYLLSSAIAADYAEEAALLEKVTVIEAPAASPAPELPRFVAPSSYGGLRRKMQEEARITAEREAAATARVETPVLHQELLLRVKGRWNKAVADVQSALCAFALQYQQYRERRVRAAIEDVVEARGYTMIRLSATGPK